MHEILDQIHIIFENDDFAVIDKPSGLLVHPVPVINLQSSIFNHLSSTLVDWLVSKYPNIHTIIDPVTQEKRFGIVHRLDKETSGIMIVAKNQMAFDALKSEFQNHRVTKIYTALVWGNMPKPNGAIKLSIAKSKHGTKRTVRRIDSPTNKQAETEWRVTTQYLNNGQPLSLLTLSPKTGRTHQIRVHCAAIGHPVIGDYLYGGKTTHAYRDRLPRLFLHAQHIVFTFRNTQYEFTAPLPRELEMFLKTLQKPNPVAE